MSQRIVKWLAVGAIMAAAGTAIGDTFNVTAPVITATNAEILGPRSQFTFQVVDTGSAPDLGNAVTVDSVTLIGLDSAGVPVTSPVNASYTLTAAEITLPMTNANGSIGATTVDLSTSTNDDFVFTAPGVVAIMVRVTEGGTNVDSVFNATDEALDETFTPDITPPIISSIFRQAGTDNTFFVVFNESLSLAGIGTNVAANQTVPANVTEADFEVSTAMVFGPLNDALSDQTFLSNNTVIRFDIAVMGADDLAVGAILRAASTMDLMDAVGNRIVGATGAGVTVSTPPAFTVTRAEWRKTSFGGGNSDAFAVVFSTPVATAGDSTFYQGPGSGSLTHGGADSDLFFNGVPVIDSTSPSSVLVDLGCCSGDIVLADGRDFNGSTYGWNYNTGTGAAPTDIFGSALTPSALATPTTVLDEITPTQQFYSFHDLDRDGKIDAIGVVFDEPVTTNASGTTFTLRKINGTVQPVLQITAQGVLTDDSVVADALPANNVIAVSSVTLGNISLNDGFPSRIETNNGILINFDPNLVNWDNDAATAVGSASEAIPGTGGAGGGGSAITVESVTGFTATDASNNSTTAVAIAATGTTQDRARPDLVAARVFTGDNQSEANGANFNGQLFGENDGDPGDSISNNRVAFIFSENLIAVDNGDNENQFRFGPGGINGFADDFNVADNDGSFVTQNPANSVTLRNSQGNPALVPGVAVSILPQSGYTDAFNNEVLESDTPTTNSIAPFTRIVTDVNGSEVFSAFSFDTNSNSFVDSIRITMTQPIDPATVQVSDFSLSLGTITGVAVQGTDIVLTVTDNVVPINSVVTATYNGASDTTPIASLNTGGGTGVAVSATNFSFGVQQIAAPDAATQNLAFMDIVGTITADGTVATEPGTKVYAMLALPQVYSVTATHNNIPFTVDAYNDSSSIYAWNAWLFGSREFIYLGRDLENFQYYDNDKSLGDENDGISSYKDVCVLNVNASNLTSITFTGTGETSGDKVTNGRVKIMWDVLRTDDGDVGEVYGRYNDLEPWFGTPLRSSAVVLGTDGRFELHMSAPISAFDGKSRLSGLNRPVIIVIEKPDGKRFVASSVTASVNGGPVLFNAQNRTQASGQAVNATTFNVNLANIGMERVNYGWNLVPNNRNFGYAVNAGARPVRPNGVSESNVFVPSSSSPVQPFTNALHQFVLWGEDNQDGMWTRDEDSNMSQFWIDPNVFELFYFVMTSRGVQMGSAIDGFTGGYALAAFNDCQNYCQYGLFQFGAPLTGNTLFSGADSSTTFPNNATTQGWGLFTSKAAFNPATDIRSTNNPDLDFLFIFRNNGSQASSLNRTTIEVSSLDLLAPTGTDNPNDTTRIDAGQAFIGHWQP